MPNIANSPSHSRASPNQHPSTPKGRHSATNSARRPQQRKTQSVSPQSLSAFASSSICSSPSPRNVPMPPAEWLNQLQVPSSCDSTMSSRPSSAMSNPSSVPSSPSPCPSSTYSSSPLSLANQQEQRAALRKTRNVGVRVCPLQLIASVASA